MSNVLIDARSAIPILRSYSEALRLGELKSLSVDDKKMFRPNEESLTKLYENWKSNRGLAIAGDVLSSAYSIGIEKKFSDVAEFVFRNTEKLSLLNKIASEILQEEKTETGTSEKSESYDLIRYYRNIIKSEPKNPIAWIEMGLQYAIIGNKKKADNAMSSALQLNSDNRFIVRTISRYYQHFGDAERALHIIRRSANLKFDPWLVSAEIAYSNLLGRNSGLIKLGKSMVERFIRVPSSISELSSALGTIELHNGSKREVLKHCKVSLIEPNSNSIAQIAWIYKSGLEMQLDLNNAETLPFHEFNSFQSYFKGDFDECILNARNWQKEEILSTRPLKLATYVQAVFKNDYSNAADAIKQRLRSLNVDHGLANNLIYYLLMANRVDDAEAALKVIKLPELFHKDGADSALLATFGLYNYRKGNYEDGKRAYEASIEQLNSRKRNYLAALATANYLREEASICALQDLENLKNRLEKTCSKSRELDVKKYYLDALNIINSRMKSGK